MTKGMFILYNISRGLEVWFVNYTWIYESSDSKLFENIKFSGEISNDWPNDLLGKNVYKALDFYW